MSAQPGHTSRVTSHIRHGTAGAHVRYMPDTHLAMRRGNLALPALYSLLSLSLISAHCGGARTLRATARSCHRLTFSTTTRRVASAFN